MAPGKVPRRREALTVDDYVAGVLGGDRARLARAITLIESNSPLHEPQAQEVLRRLLPHTGKARRIGITGVPGVGKSTFIESFGLYLVRNGHKLAVLAIDPTSTRSGGSILGDKTRMEKLSREPNAFIRPSPAGASLGGVARRTRETSSAKPLGLTSLWLKPSVPGKARPPCARWWIAFCCCNCRARGMSCRL